MNLLNTFSKYMVLFFCLSMAFTSQANLLIYPTRVSFAENDRIKEITLTNTSKTTNTYRLEWMEKRAKPEGGYEDLTTEEASSFPIASNMLRYSPRQVTLKPGERQVVKLSIRRPRGLPDGEFRSHLNFKALPPATRAEKTGQTSMQINLVMSFAIPVTVKIGKLDASLNVADAKIKRHANQTSGEVLLQLQKQGIHSVLGEIHAYWQPRGGKEELLARASDFSMWAELNQLNVNLGWQNNEFTAADGTLRIEYTGVREFSGQTFINQSISIKKTDIIQLTQ